MKNNLLLKQCIDYIESNPEIKCIFTDDNYNNESSVINNLYVYINKSDYLSVFNDINSFLYNNEYLLMDRQYEYLSRYYYEDFYNINIIYIFDFDLNICDKIISIYDPYNLFDNFVTITLPFKNIEFVNNMNDLLIIIYDFYSYYKIKDFTYSYKKALEIEELFVYIYRGFYDSLNAKLGFNNLSSTMTNNYLNNLIEIIRYFDYDNYVTAVKFVIKELDKIIDKLSINLLSSFKLDFYKYLKKIIEKI